MAEHPNQLPVAPTNAAYGLAGLGVLGVERVALAVRRGLRHRDNVQSVRTVAAPLATLSSGCDGLKCSASPPTDLRDVRDSDFNACRHACK